MKVVKTLFILITLGILNNSYGKINTSLSDTITPSLPYPSNTIFEKFGDNFVLFEPNNQKLSITDKKIKIENFLMERSLGLEVLLYTNYFGNSNFKRELDLQKYISKLTGKDSNSILFESIFVNDSFVYLSLTSSYWEILPKDTFQKKFYNIIRIGKDFSQKNFLIGNIPDIGTEILPFSFQTTNNIDFKFLVRSKANNKILANFKLNNTRIDFDGYTSDSVPNILLFGRDPFMFSNFSYAYPFIGFTLLGQVYKDNLLMDGIKTFETPNPQKPGFNPLFNRNVLRQIYLYKDILHVYYTTKDSCYFTQYDTKTGTFTKARTESIQNFNNFRYTKNCLIAFTRNNQFITYKLDEI